MTNISHLRLPYTPFQFDSNFRLWHEVDCCQRDASWARSTSHRAVTANLSDFKNGCKTCINKRKSWKSSRCQRQWTSTHFVLRLWLSLFCVFFKKTAHFHWTQLYFYVCPVILGRAPFSLSLNWNKSDFLFLQRCYKLTVFATDGCCSDQIVVYLCQGLQYHSHKLRFNYLFEQRGKIF